MRKLFVICFGVFTALTVGGQKLKQAQVPAVVKSAFQKKFAGATEVKWEKESDKFEVNFEQNDHEMSAVFTNTGMLEETEMDIKKTDLPTAAISYISKNYSGSKIKEVAKMAKANGETNYEVQIKNIDVIFDAKGKFLKTVKKARD